MVTITPENPSTEYPTITTPPHEENISKLTLSFDKQI